MPYPHLIPDGTDPADVDVPDPQFGTFDAQALVTMLGEPRLELVRWMSFAKEQQACIVALRQQVAALKAQSGAEG